MKQRTDRLILREFAPDDWRAVRAYQSDPRYLRFYEWEERSEADVRAFVDMFIGFQHETPRTKFQLAITLPEGGELIGNCGIRVRDPAARAGDIGYELNPRFWGRGYATEAARAMLAYGFGPLGLHRVSAECLAENTASAHVLEKIGMRREGHLRENVWMKGRWRDTLLYAILDHESVLSPTP
ncbi:MAG: GNAT family N-acetyltransferase [Thermomicrobiales bacterium]